jgi:hypothetical protein
VFDGVSEPVAGDAVLIDGATIVAVGPVEDAAVVSAMTEAARIMAAGGVTTCRDLGDRAYLSLGLRGRPGLPTIGGWRPGRRRRGPPPRPRRLPAWSASEVMVTVRC